MAECLQNLDSQRKFIKYITSSSHLEEFVCRFNTPFVNAKSFLTQCILDDLYANHSDLIANMPNLIINTELNKSPRYKNPPDIYAVVEFKDGILPLGHITFHLIPNQCGSNIGNGPIHVRNNCNTSKKKTRRIRVNPEQCNKYTFMLGSKLVPNCDLREIVEELANATLDVLTRWFDPQYGMLLSTRLCKPNKFVKEKVDDIREAILGNKYTRRNNKRK